MGEKGTRISEGKVEKTMLELHRNKRLLPNGGIANWFEFNGQFFITAKAKLRTDKNIVYKVYKST